MFEPNISSGYIQAILKKLYPIEEEHIGIIGITPILSNNCFSFHNKTVKLRKKYPDH